MAKHFGFTSLTGGGTGALDAIDGSILTAGDTAAGGDTNEAYFFVLDGSGDAESSPDVIVPDNNAGVKRWKRKHDEDKAYRAASPTNGHMASVDADGDLVDSGKIAADVTTSAANLVNNNFVKATGNKTVADSGRAITAVAHYVDRGDPAANDFAVGNLTTDGAAHDLDLSAIVPANATLVHLRVAVQDDVVQRTINFYKNGNANTVNGAICSTNVANQTAYYDIWVVPDANRVIEYVATNATWTTIYITVRGWFI